MCVLDQELKHRQHARPYTIGETSRDHSSGCTGIACSIASSSTRKGVVALGRAWLQSAYQQDAHECDDPQMMQL